MPLKKEQMNNKEINYFVRTLIVFLCLGIGYLIIYNFLYTNPKGFISGELITLLIILLVLVLAESFDNFSVGKLFSIQRNLKKKEIENEKLEKKNNDLFNQLINISTNQNQTTTSVFGDYYSDRKKINQIKDVDENVVQELLDSIGNSIVITEMENLIKSELDERQLTYDSPTDTVLIRHLAGTQLALQFEYTHTQIFGSQIALLKDLNTNIPLGNSTENVNEYIHKVFQQFSDSFKDWDYEKYLEFLYSSQLITIKDHNIHITNKGVDYLSWIIRNGRKENNPL